MPMPLYGFVEGDTAGLLMPAEEGDTIMELAGKLQDAAGIRVVRNDNVDVVYDGKVIDPELTVVQAGLQALDRFDVIRRRTR
jgi:Toluene-4-monooxygenase system protein B (TmoB)